MGDVMLSVKEMAEIKGCSERYVRLMVERGLINVEVIDGQSTGRGGLQYRIPLSALDESLRLKYKRLQRKKENLKLLEESAPDYEDKPPEDEPGLNSLTQAERDEIIFWKTILQKWQVYRYMSKLPKDEADKAFIEEYSAKHTEVKLTRRILYRKQKLLKGEGEHALLDRRGKHENHSRKLVPEMWDIFESYYLDESRRSAALCRTLTELEIKKQGLNLGSMPSLATFNRAVEKIPEPYILYFRFGEKVYKDKAEPYIKRIYENLEPNDIWVADNHTFDIMVYDGSKPVRLYLTAFMDVRTRKMMGWCVTDRPSGDATIYALRNGIEKYGIPKQLYTDNGREFLFHDFGGNGFRKKSANEIKYPSILNDLEIDFKTAIPRNARAKGIERAFFTVKETFSKLFDAYTGGNILEKPGRLKDVVKNPDRMKKVEEFTQFASTYLAGWYNKQPHSGEGMYGKSPDEMFAALLVEQRKATADQLALMFMRWSKPLKVGKLGVTLTFYGQKLDYSDDYLWANYKGREVYVRYSPDNLSEVRVYDIDEKFICTAKLKNALPYNASKEEISKAQQDRRHTSKVVTDYLKKKGIKTTDALDLIMEKAAENLKIGENIDPKVLHPFFSEYSDENSLDMAAGYEYEETDWTAVLNRIEKRVKEGGGDSDE